MDDVREIHVLPLRDVLLEQDADLLRRRLLFHTAGRDSRVPPGIPMRCYHARRPIPITSRKTSMRTLRATLALAVLLCVTPLLAQQEPWDAPPFSSDPKALLAAAEKVPTGDSDLVALLDEAVYTYD